MFEDLNFWAIVLGGVAGVALGMVWYSPKIGFGKKWMTLAGVREEKVHGGDMAKMASMGFLTAVFVSTAFAIVLRIANATTLTDVGVIGLIVWLGFIVPILMSPILWERKPFSLFYINGGFELVRIMVVGAILVMW